MAVSSTSVQLAEFRLLITFVTLTTVDARRDNRELSDTNLRQDTVTVAEL